MVFNPIHRRIVVNDRLHAHHEGHACWLAHGKPDPLADLNLDPLTNHHALSNQHTIRF